MCKYKKSLFYSVFCTVCVKNTATPELSWSGWPAFSCCRARRIHEQCFYPLGTFWNVTYLVEMTWPIVYKYWPNDGSTERSVNARRFGLDVQYLLGGYTPLDTQTWISVEHPISFGLTKSNSWSAWAAIEVFFLFFNPPPQQHSTIHLTFSFVVKA